MGLDGVDDRVPLGRDGEQRIRIDRLESVRFDHRTEPLGLNPVVDERIVERHLRVGRRRELSDGLGEGDWMLLLVVPRVSLGELCLAAGVDAREHGSLVWIPHSKSRRNETRLHPAGAPENPIRSERVTDTRRAPGTAPDSPSRRSAASARHLRSSRRSGPDRRGRSTRRSIRAGATHARGPASGPHRHR